MVNGQYYAPVALPPEKEPLIPTWLEGGWEWYANWVQKPVEMNAPGSESRRWEDNIEVAITKTVHEGED
jgi:hypothetical protein